MDVVCCCIALSVYLCTGPRRSQDGGTIRRSRDHEIVTSPGELASGGGWGVRGGTP